MLSLRGESASVHVRALTELTFTSVISLKKRQSKFSGRTARAGMKVSKEQETEHSTLLTGFRQARQRNAFFRVAVHQCPELELDL
jgi:hypothetical protein